MLGVDGDGGYAQLRSGAEHADGDLGAVGNQQALKTVQMSSPLCGAAWRSLLIGQA